MTLLTAYEIRTWDAGGKRVVTASGELDLNAAPTLREMLVEMAELRQLDLIVDMGEATFIDSTVIGVLAGRRKAHMQEGGSLRLVCRNANVLRTLEIAGMRRAFEIYTTLTEALAADEAGQ